MKNPYQNTRLLLTFVISFPYFVPRMGKAISSLLVVFVLLLVVPLHAIAQSGTSVVQIVTVEVKPITKIAVNGNPGALTVVGQSGDPSASSAGDNSTRYSMVTNLDNVKIVASISDEMPGGTRLMVKLESSKGVSNGPVDISRALTPVNVVSGINRGSDLNQTITYTFAAAESVNEINEQSRVITLTLTD